MNRYDPDNAPDPAEWLALEELTRIQLVEEHHRLARIKLPNLKAHAVFHAVVENPGLDCFRTQLMSTARPRSTMRQMVFD